MAPYPMTTDCRPSEPVLPPNQDLRFAFRAHGRPCAARVRVWEVPEAIVVIVTETGDNPGMSVTNCAEELANALTADGIVRQADHLVYVEHYNEDSYGASSDPGRDSYEIVTFERSGDRFRRARWNPVSRADIEALVGGRIG